MNIGVVIVNWNSGDFLISSVSSILNQSYKAHRLVVVDNASSDHSMNSINHLSDNFETLVMQRNMGFAYANNHAIDILDDCEWVALLNPDAIADPRWLEALASEAQRQPEFHSFASCMFSMDDPHVVDGAGDCYHVSGIVWRRFHGRLRESVPIGIDRPVFGPCGGAAFYRRASFIACGGFDASYFCYCEDSDLAFRMQLRGMGCLYVHKAIVLHKGGGTQKKGLDIADYYGHRNLTWTWVKNMPTLPFVIFFPVFLLQNIVLTFFKCILRKDLVVVKSKWNAIADIQRIIKMRKEVQISRSVSSVTLLRKMSMGIFRQ